jgi:phosphate-selective porin OprO/OprP
MLIALLVGALVAPSDPPSAPAPPPAAPAQSTAPQRAEPAPPSGVRFVWNDHPSVRAGSWFRVDFLGKFQWDARDPGDDPRSFKSTELQRARVGVEGVLFRHFEYNVERELTERELEGTSSAKPWKDAYVEIDYTDRARVRIGKFKVPFGLDQLTSISSLDFIYRSLGTSYLTPARDKGVMVSGRPFGTRFTYAAGVFQHDGENARTGKIVGADETGVVRVTYAPFRRPGASVLDQLEVGAALAVSKLANESELPNGLRGRTVVSRYVFFEPVFVNGRRQRFEVDADWTWEGLGVRAEYAEVRDTRTDQGLDNDDLPAARGRAWYVSGAYVLTGERKNRPVNPRREFIRDGIKAGGAVEAVGRYEQLRFDSAGGQDLAFRHPRAENILPNTDGALTLGVNWYVNRWVKFQVQGVREHLQDPERNPVPGKDAFWNSLSRLQFVF